MIVSFYPAAQHKPIHDIRAVCSLPTFATSRLPPLPTIACTGSSSREWQTAVWLRGLLGKRRQPVKIAVFAQQWQTAVVAHRTLSDSTRCRVRGRLPVFIHATPTARAALHNSPPSANSTPVFLPYAFIHDLPTPSQDFGETIQFGSAEAFKVDAFSIGKNPVATIPIGKKMVEKGEDVLLLLCVQASSRVFLELLGSLILLFSIVIELGKYG